jgi:hypothetical protein
MSRFMLSVGLFLGSLAGFSGALQAVQPAQPASTGEVMQEESTLSLSSADLEGQKEKFGPYDTYGEAFTVAVVLNALGYATEIVQEADGWYVYAEL